MTDRDQEFMEFVRDHAEDYKGILLTHAEIGAIESRLGMRFPAILTWLWIRHGTSLRCGFDNFLHSIERTLELRKKSLFPETFLLMNDWNDVGVVVGQQVVMDGVPDLKVVWMDSCNLQEFFATGSPPFEADVYPTYLDWLVKRYEMEEE